MGTKFVRISGSLGSDDAQSTGSMNGRAIFLNPDKHSLGGEDTFVQITGSELDVENDFTITSWIYINTLIFFLT